MLASDIIVFCITLAVVLWCCGTMLSGVAAICRAAVWIFGQRRNVDASEDLPRESFVDAMCVRAGENGWWNARPSANSALDEFLRDEGAVYGDLRYGWTRADARTFADQTLLDV